MRATRISNSQLMATQTPATTANVSHRAIPRFIMEKTGLCIDTDITELHHLLKLLFNSIDAEKVRQRAMWSFSSLPIPERHDGDQSLLLASDDPSAFFDDPYEEAWMEGILAENRCCCFIIYQIMGRERSDIRQQQSKRESSELLLSMATRAYIYHHQSDNAQKTKGEQYLRCTDILLEKCYTVSSRATLRALVHLFSFHFLQHPEKAFQYGDLAVRMAQDLIMYGSLKNGKTNDEQQAEDDRRLWWSAYWCNLYTVIEYNRPSIVQDVDFSHVAMPRKLSSETAEVGYCIDYCMMSIKLLQIRRSIAQTLKSKRDSRTLLNEVRNLEEQLDRWMAELPDHAKVHRDALDNNPLSVELSVLLHVQFQSVKIQMYQCFMDNTAALNLIALHNCSKAADSIIEMLTRYTPVMRTCTFIRLLPTLHRCVTTVISNATSSDPKASVNVLSQLQQFRLILQSHCFPQVPDVNKLVQTIDAALYSHSTSSTVHQSQKSLHETDLHALANIPSSASFPRSGNSDRPPDTYTGAQSMLATQPTATDMAAAYQQQFAIPMPLPTPSPSKNAGYSAQYVAAPIPQPVVPPSDQHVAPGSELRPSTSPSIFLTSIPFDIPVQLSHLQNRIPVPASNTIPNATAIPPSFHACADPYLTTVPIPFGLFDHQPSINQLSSTLIADNNARLDNGNSQNVHTVGSHWSSESCGSMDDGTRSNNRTDGWTSNNSSRWMMNNGANFGDALNVVSHVVPSQLQLWPNAATNLARNQAFYATDNSSASSSYWSPDHGYPPS